LGLALAILAASTSSIMIRFAQNEAPSLVIAAYRLGLATLALLPLFLIKYRPELNKMSRREIGMAVFSGLFLAVHFATWITSLEFTTVASSVVLVQTSPLFVTLVSPFLLKERPSPTIILGLLLALFGSLVVGISDACVWKDGLLCPPLSTFTAGTAIRGDLLALTGAVAGAGYLLIGRKLRGTVSLIPYITLAYGTAAIALVMLVLLRGQNLFGYSSSTYLLFGLLAFFPQLFAHSTYNWSLRYVSAALVSISLLAEPVASAVLALFILEEVPPALRLAGALLILVGIAIAARKGATMLLGSTQEMVPE
jgi:drug/metabolite transporter (DMT)-like permease